MSVSCIYEVLQLNLRIHTLSKVANWTFFEKWSWLKCQVEFLKTHHPQSWGPDEQSHSWLKLTSIALLTFTKYPFQIGEHPPSRLECMHAARRWGRIWGTETCTGSQSLSENKNLFQINLLKKYMFVFYILVDNLSFNVWKPRRPGKSAEARTLNIYILTLLLLL
jgi:hypothetical protein